MAPEITSSQWTLRRRRRRLRHRCHQWQRKQRTNAAPVSSNLRVILIPTCTVVGDCIRSLQMPDIVLQLTGILTKVV